MGAALALAALPSVELVRGPEPESPAAPHPVGPNVRLPKVRNFRDPFKKRDPYKRHRRV
jgi:hypothetical protein